MALPALFSHPAEAIAEIASSCRDRVQFAREMLTWLGDTVGYSRAFFANPGGLTASSSSRRPDVAANGYPGSELELLVRRAPLFAAELAPVKKAAVANEGVAVDTAVLGPKACEAQYYRELVAPAGGGHSMLCFFEVRGQAQGLLMIGRAGTGFRAHEIDRMQRLSRPLAVALASFVQTPLPGVPESMQALLSPRERDIASYLRLGYTNAEIARALGTSPNTVRNQLSGLFRKVGASTRAELVGLLLPA
jgi:DNA-binding CsgD family transcriptional regulator